MRTLDDAPFLDILSPGFRADPDGAIDALRQDTWIVRTGFGGMVISRKHVQTLLGDRRLRSMVVDFIEMQGVTSGLLHDRMCATLLAVDGADHSRVRALVRKAFTPAAINRHRPVMRDILGSLLAPLGDQTRWDFVEAVAEHYPIQVMCAVLGVPAEDHPSITAWTKAFRWVLSFDLPAHLIEAEAAMKLMDDYVADLVARRRAQPADDLVTELVQAEEAGDRLSGDELQSLIIGLLFAGYDTTRNQLGLAMWIFAQHPDQWALLAERPELAAAAVEEVMRYRGAVAVAPRLVGEDFDLDGYHLTAGTPLSLRTAAANRDPAAYDDPGRFDITAQREPQLTFGGGPHYCLGASLARAEMQEALPILARRLPGLRLDGDPTWGPPMNIFGPDTLPIRSELPS